MSLYVFLSLIWLALLVSLAALVVMWPSMRSLLRSAGFALALITLLFLALYVTPAHTSFLGLEYEDAFEYAYAGQVLGQQAQTRSFELNPVCVDGTTHECRTYATLSHPIGLSTLLSWPVRIVGASGLYGGVVSLVFMWFASIGVFILLRGWNIGTPYALVGAILFMSTPVCMALGGTSLAEPVTAGLIVMVLVLSEAMTSWLPTDLAPTRHRFLQLCLVAALFSALTVAVFTKRESLVLLLMLPLGYLFVALLTERSHRSRLLIDSCVSVTAVGAGVFVFSWVVGSTALLDWSSIRPTSSPAFSIGNLQRFGGDYIHHLVSSRFLVLAPLALLGVFLLGRAKRPAVLLPIIAGYVLLFASFSQDYYTQNGGQVPYFHFERYTIEIAPLLAVLGAVAISRFGEWAATRTARRALFAGVGILGVSLAFAAVAIAFPYRRSLAVEEANLRRKPVQNVCSHIPSSGWVISSQPILFFMYCGRPVHIIATEMLDAWPALRVQLAQLRDVGVLYLWANVGDGQLDSQRYPALGRLLRAAGRERIFRVSNSGTSFDLYRLRRA